MSEYLRSVRGYEGAAGTIDFDPATWDTGKKYVLKTIVNETFVVLA